LGRVIQKLRKHSENLSHYLVWLDQCYIQTFEKNRNDLKYGCYSYYSAMLPPVKLEKHLYLAQKD